MPVTCDPHMKTIRISIDEAILGSPGSAHSQGLRPTQWQGGRAPQPLRAGAPERSAIARHKDLLARQAAALVGQRAEP